MSNARNYRKELDTIMADSQNRGKKLFIHACCAPCSSYCLELLRPFFEVTVFYYNPNITYEKEYRLRVQEEKRLIDRLNMLDDGAYKISYVDGEYEPDVFLEQTKGYEDCPEGGERCRICFEIRLKETAIYAAKGGYDFFTTTLTISPLKNAGLLNEIGETLGKEYKVRWLPTDFKKKDGYKRSIELSKEYGLYRQDYCGCAFSKAERERQKTQEEKNT